MIRNNSRYVFVIEFANISPYGNHMSSGKPVCPICDKEHDDGNDFDTITVCKNCIYDIRQQPSIDVIRKMYRRFECDMMAFKNRKDILLQYMREEYD